MKLTLGINGRESTCVFAIQKSKGLLDTCVHI